MSPPKDGDPAWELGVPPGVPLRRVSSAHASPLTLRTDRWRVIFRTLPLTYPHLLSLSFPVVTLALRWSLTHPFTGSWVMMLQEGKGLDSKGQVNTPTCNSSGMPYTRATSDGRPVPWVNPVQGDPPQSWDAVSTDGAGVVQSPSRVWLFWDPMGYSTPGFPVPHSLPGLAHACVYWICDAILCHYLFLQEDG